MVRTCAEEDDANVLKALLYLEVSGKKRRGKPKKTQKTQVKEVTERFSSKMENATNNHIQF